MSVDAPAEFVNFLRTEQERGIDTTLEDRRAVALRFYQGQPYGDEVEGRSQATTRDTAEVVDFMQVGILNTILASGKAVEFETEPEPETDENGQPVSEPIMGPNGQPAAGPDGQPLTRPVMADYGEQATAAVRYQFFRKQKGYRILHDCLKAGQIEKTGIIKTFAEPQPAVHEVREVPAGEVEQDADGNSTHAGAQVIAGEPFALEVGQDVLGQPIHMPMARITVAHPQPPVFRDVAVPNEYFRVALDAIDLDDAIYVGEYRPTTKGEMIALGYDLSDLDAIWGNGTADTVIERTRDYDRSQTRLSVGNRTGANRQLWLAEEYPLYDLDGDGIAERLFVHRIGNTVLRVEPIDEQPYSLWSPFPSQHRLVGDSTADKTMDIQRIRSVLLRQGLDSQYLANVPRTLVDEGSLTPDTIDDLLNVRPGGLIRYKNNAPQPLEQRDTSTTAFQAMEMMSAERESRTGITRQSQGLNPDTMNKTASGMAMLQANAQQIELYITRNFAEMIVASIFAKRYRLMRRYGQPFRMKIEGKYQTIDPRRWPDEMDVTINVGIGTGSKDQKIAARNALFQIMQNAVAGGSRVFSDQQIYENTRGFVQDSGLGDPAQYVIDPSTLPPPEPKPDPETAKAQVDGQTQQAKDAQAHEQAMARLQLQQQEQQASQALKGQQNEFDLQAKREKAGLDADLAHAKAAEEARLAQQTADREWLLAQQRMEREFELKRQEQQQREPAGGDDLPGYRPGGSLAE
jgi:hypothetical protein